LSNSTSPATADPASAADQASGGADELPARFLLRWMFGFLKPVRRNVILACCYLAAFCAVEVLTVRQGGNAVDDIKALQVARLAEPQPPPAGFWQWLTTAEPASSRLRDTVVGFVLLTACLLLLRYLTTVSRTQMSMQMVYYIREAVYDKLQRVGFGFHDSVSSGQLINRALSDLQNVRTFVETAVLTTLEITLIVGGYIILIMTLSPWVALLALAPLPIWTWYVLRFSKRIQPAAKAVMEAEDRNVAIIAENIAGVHVVKAFATERQEIEKYNGNADGYIDRVRKRIRLFADFQPVIRGIASASYLLLFLAAGVLIIYGNLTVGSLLVLGGAMSQILTRLQQVSVINEQYQNAIVSARRLHEVLFAPPTIPEAPNAEPLPPGPGAVRFENVSFGYGPDKRVLHDISFDVPGGSLVAIVGPTGAGKTTLVNLISRFYDPQQGRVLIDGVDVRDATIQSLRTQVSLVFQETYLFSDTVAGNIAFGRPNLSEGEIESAARLAQAHDFIEELPLGYRTMLGERGSSLSGGQRQRLAIARAVVTNPRVLILDDATAAVDPATEDLIRKAMRFVMSGRTTFVIAHRISTVKSADLVIVLETGRVTQSGTHQDLMSRDGHYRQIAAVQLHGDDVARDAEGQTLSHMDRVKDERQVQLAAVQAQDEPV